MGKFVSEDDLRGRFIIGKYIYEYPLKIFMLMPFGEELKYVYENYIKKSLEEIGDKITRVDDIFKSAPIMEDVLHKIKTSDLIIADLTNHNPNVFYELGIAHTIKKHVIQISQDNLSIPFDTSHIRTIIYSYDDNGLKYLTETLKKFIYNYKRDKHIENLTKMFEESGSYDEAGELAEEFLKFEDNLTKKQITRFSEAMLNNRQVYQSGTAKDTLEPFFGKYLDYIPNYIIEFLKKNHYNFQ